MANEFNYGISEVISNTKKNNYQTDKKLIEGFAVTSSLAFGVYFIKGIAGTMQYELPVPDLVENMVLISPIVANTFLGKKLDENIKKYNFEKLENILEKESKINTAGISGIFTAGVCLAGYGLGSFLGYNTK
jgi:hypothetical protein